MMSYVGTHGIGDLSLPALQLDQIAESVGAQPYPRDHAKYLLELHGVCSPDVGGIEEVPNRRGATAVEAHPRQIGLIACFHRDRVEQGNRARHTEAHAL